MTNTIESQNSSVEYQRGRLIKIHEAQSKRLNSTEASHLSKINNERRIEE